MKIVLEAERSRWLPLPGVFPTADGETAEQWEDAVVAGMREAWHGAFDDSEPLVRAALRQGAASVLPDDSITLQYWPTASIINTVVHIAARDFGPDESPRVIPLDDGPFVVAPVSEAFSTDELGTGVESRYLVRVDSVPPMTLGGASILFENDTSYVYVGVEPTVPSVIGMMLDELHTIVRSIRVLDDAGRARWVPAAVDPASLPARGETWDVEAVVATG